MKAVQIALILLCINAGLFIVDSTDAWSATDVGGTTPQSFEEGMVVENTSNNIKALPSALNNILGNKLTIGVIVAGVLLGGVSTFAASVTTPKAVGILAFTTIFSVLLGNLTGLLTLIQVPTSVVTVITGFQYFWLAMAVIQMSTGTSFEVLQ